MPASADCALRPGARRGVNLAIATFLLCGHAYDASAQTIPAETPFKDTTTDAKSGDIIVTALRRPLDERTIPAAVSVLASADLRAESIRSFENLARADSSLQLSAYQGETQLFIRGIGAVTFLGGFESSVAVNLDDVYLGRPTAIAPAYFDLDRVEILKGPQGTLYGRNATGGAINLVTRAPTADWEADGHLAVGNYGRADAMAGVSGPITDNLTFRVAVGTNNHDGFTRVYLGRDSSGKARYARAEDQHDVNARARIDWAISPAVKLQLSGDFYRADDRAVVFHFAGPGYANNPLFLAHLAEGEQGVDGTRTINSSFLPYNKPETWGASAKLIADLGGAIVTSTTAYRKTMPRSLDDLSNSTVLGESQFKSENASQFSEEIILRSSQGGPLTYLVGASFYLERNQIRNEFFLPYLVTYLGGSGTAGCCLLRADGAVDTDAYAAFGELGYAVGPRTKLTLGGRFGHERRWGDNFLDFTGYLTLNQARFEPATFNSFTPKFAIEQKLGSNAFLWGSVTKGYKAGGFNVGSGQNTPYSPEKIWSYEIGTKFTLTSGLAVDISAFHYDYTDLQVQDVNQNTVLIRNAATAKVDGAELDAKWQATHRWSLGLMATYLHARFSRYDTINTKTPRLGVLDLSGNPLPQAPRWRFVGNAEYDLPIGGWGSLRLRGDASWQDRIYFSAFKDPRATQSAYWWLKARATLMPARGRYTASLFVDNLTNSQAFTNISITGDLDASRALGNLAPPRTWGLELSYTF